MNLGRPIAPMLALLGSAALLTACVTPYHTGPRPTARPTASTQPAGVSTSSASPGARRGTPLSLPPQSTTIRRSDRYRALVGLYGELMSPAGPARSSHDGAGNLAQVTIVTEGACFDPDVDRTGQWLAFASTMHRPTADIYVKSTVGKTVTRLTNDPAEDVMPAFSPDGKRIAFASTRSGNWDIYMTSMDGARPVQLTNDPDHELHATWSPDGTRIAYCKLGARSGRWEIWVTDVNNPGIRQFLDYGVFPQWCPDVVRNKILFQRARERGSRFFSIWTIDYINGEAMYPTEIVSASNAAIINPAWSADGSRIVFATVVDPEPDPDMIPEQSDLWIVNLDGSGRSSLTNGQFANFQPVWAKDGKVYFVSNRSGVDNIWAVDATRSVELTRGMSTGTATVQMPEETIGRQP